MRTHTLFLHFALALLSISAPAVSASQVSPRSERRTSASLPKHDWSERELVINVEKFSAPKLLRTRNLDSLSKRQNNGTDDSPIFFRNNNVWYRDASGQETQISTTGTDDSPFSNITYPSPDNKFVVVFQSTPAQDHTVHEVESSPYDQVQPRLHQFQYLKPGDNVTIDRPRMFDLAIMREVSTDNALFENPYQLYSLNGGWSADGSEFRFIYNQRGHQIVRIVGMSTKGDVRAIVEEKSDT